MTSYDLFKEYLIELNYNAVKFNNTKMPGTYQTFDDELNIIWPPPNESTILVKTYNSHHLEFRIKKDSIRCRRGKDKESFSVKLNHPDSLEKLRAILNF